MTDLSSLTADQLAEKVVAAWEAMSAGRPLAERQAPAGTSDALAELVRRLKTAEDALERIGIGQGKEPPGVVARDALAAIRPNPDPDAPQQDPSKRFPEDLP